MYLIFLGVGVDGTEGVDAEGVDTDGVKAEGAVAGLLDGEWGGGEDLGGDWASDVLGGGEGLDWGGDDLFVGGDWSGDGLDGGDWGGEDGLVGAAGDDGLDGFLDWLDFLGDLAEWGDDLFEGNKQKVNIWKFGSKIWN